MANSVLDGLRAKHAAKAKKAAEAATAKPVYVGGQFKIKAIEALDNPAESSARQLSMGIYYAGCAELDKQRAALAHFAVHLATRMKGESKEMAAARLEVLADGKEKFQLPESVEVSKEFGPYADKFAKWYAAGADVNKLPKIG